MCSGTVYGGAAAEPMMPSLAISVNREYAEVDRVLREGDEVALLPPVSGGSGETGEVGMVADRLTGTLSWGGCNGRLTAPW